MSENPLNSYDLAKYASEISAALPVAAGDFLGTRGGRLTYKGQPVAGDRMDVVILDFIRENQYYPGIFNPDAPSSPVCYAYGNDDSTRTPHPKSAEPQSETCASCPLNQFGSSDTGKGKMCKNVIRLALVPAGALDDLANTDVAFLKVPVTSVKAFSAYAQQIAQSLKRPPFAMVTRISLHPDPKAQFRVAFEAVEPIESPDHIGEILKKREGIVLETPYAEFTEDTTKKPTRNPGRFTGSRKL